MSSLLSSDCAVRVVGARRWGALLVWAGFWALVLGGLCPEAHAQSGQAGQTLAFTLAETTTFEVSGAPSMALSNVGVSEETDDGEASYALVTNTGKPKEIRASLDQSVPDGLTLEAYVDPPDARGTGATSSGWTALTADEQVVVNDVQKVDDEGVPITYRAAATTTVAPGSYVFTVTYTITDAN